MICEQNVKLCFLLQSQFVNLAPVVFVVLRVKVNGKNGIGVHGNPTG